METARIIGVEHDQRVQIPVTRMENVGDLQSITIGHFLDAAQYVRQPAGRDRTIHTQIIRADSSNRAERTLAALPDRERFLDRLRHSQTDRIVPLANRLE